AIERKIPVLAFLHAKPEKIEVGKTDRNENLTKKLIAFRDRLSTGRIVDFWTDPHELCTKVVIAIAQAINLAPGVGWVRGDQAIDAKVVQDMERLRIENDRLKERLGELDSSEITFPPHLAGPDSQFELNFYYGGQGTYETANERYKYRTTWKEIFLDSIDQILKEVAEGYIVGGVAKLHATKVGVELRKVGGIVADVKDVRAIRFQLEALGLIR